MINLWLNLWRRTMSFLSRLFGKKDMPPANVWPNSPTWSALKNDVMITTEVDYNY